MSVFWDGHNVVLFIVCCGLIELDKTALLYTVVSCDAAGCYETGGVRSLLPVQCCSSPVENEILGSCMLSLFVLGVFVRDVNIIIALYLQCWLSVPISCHNGYFVVVSVYT